MLCWLAVMFVGLCSMISAHGQERAVQRPLLICYEDVPEFPWTNPDGTGLTLDMMRQIAAELHLTLRLQPLPWTRCLDELKFGSVDAVLGAGYRSDRHSFGRFPQMINGNPDDTRALYDDVYAAYSRKGEHHWDRQGFVALKTPVAVPRDYSVVIDRLEHLHVKILSKSKSALDALRYVQAGLADVAVLPKTQADQLLDMNPELRAQLQRERGPVHVMPVYLLAGQQAYRERGAEFEAIWDAVRVHRRMATP